MSSITTPSTTTADPTGSILSSLLVLLTSICTKNSTPECDRLTSEIEKLEGELTTTKPMDGDLIRQLLLTLLGSKSFQETQKVQASMFLKQMGAHPEQFADDMVPGSFFSNAGLDDLRRKSLGQTRSDDSGMMNYLALIEMASLVQTRKVRQALTGFTSRYYIATGFATIPSFLMLIFLIVQYFRTHRKLKSARRIVRRRNEAISANTVALSDFQRGRNRDDFRAQME